MNPTGIHTSELQTKSVTIDTDLSNKTYHLVTFDTTDSGVVNLAVNNTLPMYVLIDDGNGSSTPLTGTVAISGRTLVKLGGTVTAGQPVGANSDGEGVAVTADTGRHAGFAINSGVDGDLIEIECTRGVVSAA